ncbi:hypothetical protein Y032_0009g653 [Ancylostoma ceylanicum]|uniref:MULE transposase domain-containing protein n=1 Tax=Ancylostoma ceylanicum TaxID=53326 RepID=A0A016VIS5_9BILA|nr:hypothetical protein Y032_0009g653 [Ancylostoma ceylanicum]
MTTSGANNSVNSSADNASRGLSLISAQAARARAGVTGRLIPQTVRQDHQHVRGSLLPVRVARRPNPASGRNPSAAPRVFAGPSSSSAACIGPAPRAPVSVRVRAAPSRPRERFFGEREVSQAGKHEVLKYKIPGSRMSHIFTFQRRNQGYEVYVCRQCKNAGFHLPIKVVGNEFFGDPCRNHVCLPVNAAEDQVDRMMYKKCRNVRDDPHYANASNVEIWEEALVDCLENPAHGNPTEREEMTAYLHRHGLEARRRTIARSKEMHRDRMLTWENIPENFAYLSDGTPFLQERTATLQIYYSVDTIRRVCEKGLRALVANGVHKILPTQLGDQAQLYTIHGVTESGHEVPLVHALTKNKTQATYEKIFERLQQELQTLAPNLSPLRIILDFEVAALNAAEKVFRTASIEGYVFHLSQA